jgi:putative flippase GtrA
MKKSILINRETIIQFLKFGMIGLVNTGIHYGVFLLLFRPFGFHYLLASSIGYCAGLINSFILNKRLTFRTMGTRTDIEFAKFVLVNVLALATNLGALKVFVSLIHLIPEVGQVFAIGFSIVINFLGNKIWTFSSFSYVNTKKY